MFETGGTYFKCMLIKIFKYAWKFPSGKQGKIIKKVRSLTRLNGITKIYETEMNTVETYLSMNMWDIYIYTHVCTVSSEVCIYMNVHSYKFISSL